MPPDRPGPARPPEPDARRAWLARVPRLLEECAERWSLRLGEPFPAQQSLALRATLPGGGEAVLKLGVPHRESEHEADALERWDGAGAVRLLAHDRERSALLLERASPGTPLHELDPDAALDVVVALLPRLWIPAGPPFRPLAEEVSRWEASLPGMWERAGRPFERALLDAALDALRELATTQGEQVLLHQDLHAGNVLRAAREPWLAIDPKPLAGERELGLAPLVRGPELGRSERAVVRRLDRLSGELGLDRERVRGWALGQTIAWAFEGGRALPRHVETARRLARG